MRERHGRACRSGIILFRNNDAYRCPVIEHVTGPPAPNSSKKFPSKNKRRGKPTPHRYFCVLRLSRGYSKAILDQLPNEQETAVRTDVESRNPVEAIPAQVEACMDRNGECFA
ncbi:hypothetical protein TNCV_659311 [Trichonephila clavipes]|nr:hypothetical protein TNCV_659311 [Trichonephila clavipes]